MSELEWQVTEFFLRATAGLRVKEITDKDYVAEQLQAVRSAAFEMKPRGPVNANNPSGAAVAEILSGVDEGVGGWTAANYLAGFLHGALNASRISQQAIQEGITIGALDMGGASTQLTFVPESGEVVRPIDNVTLDL